MDPVEAKHRKQLNEIARGLDTILNPDLQNRTTGFCLFLFDFGDKTKINYISNAIRKDMIKALHHWLEQAEKDLKDD